MDGEGLSGLRAESTTFFQWTLHPPTHMELKTFVSQALSSIVEGVVEAQSATAKHRACINPGGLMRSTQGVSTDAVWDNDTNNFARLVTFDVAVSVEEGTTTSAKIGVVAGFFGLGAQGASASKEQAISRIQFSIPVLLPTVSGPERARRSRAK